MMTSVDADASQPQGLSRRFGLDKSLTWKISKIVQEDDPFAAVAHLPGPSSLRALVRAFEGAGAKADTIQAVRDAVAAFDRMVGVHSGDRITFDMMVDNLMVDGRQQRMEAHRRTLFRGFSATWGVQARVQVCLNFIAPSHDPDWVDLAWLSGLIDFRRLRRDAVWAMASARKVQDDGTLMSVGPLKAIDPEFADDGVAPLLGDFCSEPRPDINIATGPDGMIRYELLEGPVGNTAAASCVIGIHAKAFVRRTRQENDTLGEHGARLYTPAELLIHDLFVHEELEYALSPTIHLYSQMPSGPVYPASGRDAGQLPLEEKVLPLGSSPPDPVTPELPRYGSMVQYVFERLGWNAERFHGFRFKMRYPPIPAIAVFRYALPESTS
jgi:hypothetical protein